MPSTPAVDIRDLRPIRGSTPARIASSGPSAAPMVVKTSGRGSVPPLRLGRFLIAPDDRIALRHIVEHHVPARGVRERLERSAALAALDRGIDGLAFHLLRRRLGARTPGPLEVEAVWTVVRGILKSCGLTGMTLRVHALTDPAAGLGYGGDLIGFGRRGSTLEATHPLVVVRVRPRSSGGGRLVREARALASVRSALSGNRRDWIPTPLGHRVSDDVEVLATSFLPGRALPLDLPRRPTARQMRKHLVAVAAALADLQNAHESDLDPTVDGSIVPAEAADEPWARDLCERLAAQALPLTPSHGDLRPDTVLFDGGRVSGIVEWARYRPSELPTRDLFDFLLAYAGRLDAGRARDGAKLVRRAFVRSTRVSRAIRRALVVYGERREMGLPVLGGLFRLHLLTRASGTGPRAVLTSSQEQAAALRSLDSKETVFTP